ncbi:MAG: OB-fold nucleic acid binding domain-containing protein, partial [Rhodobacter sp.]|nr:OB-fold nucleic acid binding domain-containing protein [Rhodobacter sp.]
WIKHHHPEVFCCALLNAQPMGFYAPAQIVRDAIRHGVTVNPVCAERSYWDSVLEYGHDGSLAVRLGFRQIRGFKKDDGQWLAAARGGGYRSIDAIWRRAGLGRPALMKLASADAFAEYGLSRREAIWGVKGLGGDRPLPLFVADGEGLPDLRTVLPTLSPGERVFEDYVTTRLTLGAHPVSLLRGAMPESCVSNRLRTMADGTWLSAAGLVIARQRPGTASGVIFLTLEDEAAVSNIVVWPKIFAKSRKSVMTGRLLLIKGRLQREGSVTHVIATVIEDYSYLIDTLGDPVGVGDTIDPPGNDIDEARSPIHENRIGTGTTSRPAKPEEVARALRQHHHAACGARHPRQQANKLFHSRDFH